MKKIKLLILLPLLLSLNACKAEDGNINDWVGSYHWGANREETWHQFITGEKAKQSEQSYTWDEYQYDFIIRDDKTWFQPNSDKIATSGHSGRIKCYKNYICFLDMPSQYHINKDYQFSLNTDSQGTWLQYYLNESTNKHGLDYDYKIRTIYLKRL